MRLRRRSYRSLVCALAIIVPVLVGIPSLQAANPRIGLLAWDSCDTTDEFGSFLKGLTELGYRLGGNVIIDCRSAGKRNDKLVAAATELVQLPVSVIVAVHQPGARAAREATDKIPIVAVVSGDPITAGLARSLAKPGGNFTGLSYYVTELTAKRLELLKETIPKLSKVGVLANPEVSYLPFEEDTKRAAGRLGIALMIRQVTEPNELGTALSLLKAGGVEAVFVLPDLMFAWEASQIATLALQHRLPTMTWAGWFVPAGCLMAYAANYDYMSHRMAFYVDRILKGANPSDLPIEQPTTFELSINLKTANILGIEIPQTILLLADKVIE